MSRVIWRECCKTVFGGPHVEGCSFCPETSPPVDYDGPASFDVGRLQAIEPRPPIVDIALDRAMRKGVAQQLRVLANVLDPPP